MAVTYTINDAVEKFGYGMFNFKLTLLLSIMYLTDGVELTLVALASPRIKCLWNLTSTETALLSSAVFGGMLCGGVYWGEIADKMGRKLPMVVCAALVVYFGLLSGVTFNVWSLFVMRAFVGFFMVCIPATVIVYGVEFIPIKYRGSVAFGFNFSYAFGSMFASGLAYLVMNNLGWRWYMILCTAPAILFLAFSTWLPESVRYLYIAGRYNDVVALLHRISRENKETLPNGELVKIKVIKERGNIFDLFTPNVIISTLVLLVIVNVALMGYFGAVFLGSQIIQSGKLDCISKSVTKQSNSTCYKLTNDDYMWNVLLSFGDLTGVLITVLFLHRVSRKVMMRVLFIPAAASFPLLYICISTTINIVVMFLARGLLLASTQIVLVYVAEFYPTRIRGTAVAFFFGTSRIGVIASIFLIEVLFEYSYFLMTIIYCALLLLTALLVSCLSADTRNTKLLDR